MYLFLSIFVLVVSMLLFRYAAGSLSIFKLNLISIIFYFQLVIQSFIGVNIAIFNLDKHYLLSKITDPEIRLITYLAVLYVMVFLPLTMVLVSKWFQFNAIKEYQGYLSKPIQPALSEKDSGMYLAMLLFTAISVLSIVYTFVSIGSWPLLEIIRGKDPQYLAQLRIDVSRNFQGIGYIKNILAITMTTVLSYISYGYLKLYRTAKWKWIFAILFMGSIIIHTYNLAKSPVIWYLLGFLFLKIYIDGRLSKKLMFIAGIGTTSLIVLFYLLLGGATQLATFLSINTGPVGRVLIGQIMGLFYHFKLFPTTVPFLEGASFPQFLLNFFDMESVRSGRIVMSIVNPSGVESGTAGVMNTLFIGEAYANFGWAGVILGTIYVGIIIQLVHIIFVRLPKNPIWIGLSAYLTIQLSTIVTGGFVDFIYSAVLIAIVFLTLLLFYTGKGIWRSIQQSKDMEY